MDKKKEILFGILWGLSLGLLFTLLMFSIGKTAAPVDDGGQIEISISGDSVQVNLEKDGIVKSVTVDGDSLQKTTSGIKVKNELLIEDGRIYIDGVELTEEELRRLSVDQEQGSEFDLRVGDKTERHIKRKRIATIYTDSDRDVVKFDDVEIESDARVAGDVVSISGDVTVAGRVNGDVVSVFGDIFLKDGAEVGGDVAAPFGHIHRDKDVTVGGEVEAHKTVKGKKHSAGIGLSARFNRVEGFTFLPGLRYEDVRGQLPSLTLDGAYAVTLKRWEYNFNIKHRMGKVWGPFFDFGMYQWAGTSDSWILTEIENTVAGLFFKEDFYDFYWMRGFTGGGGLFYGKSLEAGVHYTGIKISNLERTAEKAIFGGKKKFRENWSTVLPDSAAIKSSAGDLREVTLAADYDTRDNKTKVTSGLFKATSGLFAELRWQQAFKSGGSDFKYKIASAEFKGYFPLVADQTLFMRLRAGYSDDELPLFRRFFIGGIGSLRGYKYKEFEGNRYVLFNADYIWRFFRSDIGAGIFVDAGKAGVSGHEFESGEIKTDVGICALVEDVLRVDLAQRLDDTGKSPVVMLRGQILF